MTTQPKFAGAHLFVADMNASLAFYRRLGLTIEQGGDHFARAVGPDGSSGLQFGSHALTRGYNPNWQTPGAAAKSTLNFEVDSREAVDALYAKLTSSGNHGSLAPVDVFWGSRFAIILDPDGNEVGLQSPQDRERAFKPPVQ